MPRFLITPGDIDGIGLEITVKALNKISRARLKKITVFVTPKQSKLVAINLLTRKGLALIISQEPPPQWVEQATHLCLKKEFAGLITGPLSKPSIFAAGMRDVGHTEIFKRLTKSQDLFMSFSGPEFNVLLATGHVPLNKVSSLISRSLIERAVSSAMVFSKALGLKPKIGLLGLNPHAGDDGIIGNEDKKISSWLKKYKIKATGPLVPDAAFLPDKRRKFSCLVALYHDQGLAPFKAVHGTDGCHVTVGLPFIRTSVDHGTAKDIFNKNLADPKSMIRAINLAFKLAGG
jgi:4-hydroxy-L-threonine phosphate dehydrogenase PdxA